MQIPFLHPQKLASPVQLSSIYAVPADLRKLRQASTAQARFDGRIQYEMGIRPVVAQQLQLEMDLAGRGQRSILTHSQKVLLGYDTYIGDSYFSRGRLHKSTLEDVLKEKSLSLE